MGSRPGGSIARPKPVDEPERAGLGVALDREVAVVELAVCRSHRQTRFAAMVAGTPSRGSGHCWPLQGTPRTEPHRRTWLGALEAVRGTPMPPTHAFWLTCGGPQPQNGGVQRRNGWPPPSSTTRTPDSAGDRPPGLRARLRRRPLRQDHPWRCPGAPHWRDELAVPGGHHGLGRLGGEVPSDLAATVVVEALGDELRPGEDPPHTSARIGGRQSGPRRQRSPETIAGRGRCSIAPHLRVAGGGQDDAGQATRAGGVGRAAVPR